MAHTEPEREGGREGGVGDIMLTLAATALLLLLLLLCLHFLLL